MTPTNSTVFTFSLHGRTSENSTFFRGASVQERARTRCSWREAFRLRQFFLLGVAVWLLQQPIAVGADYSRMADELRTKYAAEVERLAVWCEQNGLAREARTTRHVLTPTDPYKLYMPVLPDEVGPPKLPDNAAPKLVEWNSRLQKLRREHAAALNDTARRSAQAGQAGLAIELAMAAIHADPDNESVRRLFGYQNFRGRWRTPYEIKKLRTGNVWSEKFGWLPKGNLRRYEDGLRYSDGRWITAEEDARRHSNVRNGWNVETEHYVVRTDHSIEAGVALGTKLERLYCLWRRLFIGFYASEADVLAIFEGRAKLGVAPDRHAVVYFRDRSDYVESLRTSVPNIGISYGMYYDRTRLAYFFPDKEDGDRTLYHEATHQLFHESGRAAAGVERSVNFWIIEGVAMYMESLRQEDGCYVLGGFDDQRLQAAQYRNLHDHFYVPLGEFIGYDMERLQKSPDIGKLYSQAAGLTHFLIHYDGGRYRDALVGYLAAVYAGHDNRATLSKLTGKTYEELDREYREFLEAGLKLLDKNTGPHGGSGASRQAN